MKFTKEVEYAVIGLSLKYVLTNRIWVSYKDELRKGSPFYEAHVKASKTVEAFSPIKG